MNLLFKTRLELERLIGPNFNTKSYVIGVSGGKDSQCLLHLMSLLIPKEQITAVHVNYALRGKDSLLDEKLVRKTCKNLDIRLEVFTPKVKNKSELHLRNIRRTYFKNVRSSSKSDYILLAHHAQDQLETLFMRLIRGTGALGLSAMKGKNGRYLRPFLSVAPEEIKFYLTANKIEYRTDQSNNEETYFRNAVRHKLIAPFEELSLRHGGIGSVYYKLNALSEELHDMRAYLEDKTSQIYLDLVSENVFWYRFSRESFLELKLYEQKLFLHFLFRKLAPKTSLSRVSIERMLRSIQQEKDLHLEGGVELSLSCNQVFFQTKKQVCVLAQVKKPLRIDASIEIPDGFELRFPLPGDRFRSGKLKKKLLEKRIPRLMRKVLPVLARSGTNDVVWFLDSSNKNR